MDSINTQIKLKRYPVAVYGFIVGIGIIVLLVGSQTCDPIKSILINLGTELLGAAVIFFIVTHYFKVGDDASRRETMAFAEQQEAYRALTSMVNNKIKKAVMIQYSCSSSIDILRTLLKNGAEVTVFIQHENTANLVGSAEQAKRITDKENFIRGELGKLYSEEKVIFYKYEAPASISAIKVDEDILLMGWYTYESLDVRSGGDRVCISGHDRAALIAFKGTSVYQQLNTTFCEIESNLKQHATPLSI